MKQQHCDSLTILAVLENAVKKHGLRKWCREHDLDPGNVSNIISLKKPMQRKVANALGFMPVIYYRRISYDKAIKDIEYAGAQLEGNTMETYELHKFISNRKLFAALRMRFDVDSRISGNFIQTRTGKGYKWHNFCRRDSIKLGIPSENSVSIHGPMGHIYTRFDPPLHQLIVDEIENMYPLEQCR